VIQSPRIFDCPSQLYASYYCVRAVQSHLVFGCIIDADICEWGKIAGSLQDSVPYKICSQDSRYIFVIVWMFELFQFSNWIANGFSFLKSQRNLHRFYTSCQLL